MANFVLNFQIFITMAKEGWVWRKCQQDTRSSEHGVCPMPLHKYEV